MCQAVLFPSLTLTLGMPDPISLLTPVSHVLDKQSLRGCGGPMR